MTENTKVREALVTLIRTEARGGAKYAAYIAEYEVTAETVKDHARALAALAFPKDDGVQTINGKRTDYGNAVQKAANGLRYNLAKAEPESSEGETEAGETESPEQSEGESTDWLALACQAVTNAAEHGVDVKYLAQMVTEALRPYRTVKIAA